MLASVTKMTRMDNDAARLGTPSTDIAGGLCAGLVLSGIDAWQAWHRPPLVEGKLDLVVFLALATSLGGVLGTLLVLLRGTVVRAAARLDSPSALVGALDGFVLVLLAVVAQNPRPLDGDARVFVLAGAIVAFGAGELIAERVVRRPTSRSAMGAAVAIAGILIASRLRWNGHEWYRLACDAAVAVGVTVALRPFLSSKSKKAAGAFFGAALLLVACNFILSEAPGARMALHHRSAHARTWAFVFQTLVDRDRDDAVSLFGGRDCDPKNGRRFPGANERGSGINDANCADRTRGPDLIPGSGDRAPQENPYTRGQATGSDVVILSIDSLRRDVVDQLAPLTNAMGPHATFQRAVSPAPGTRESLPAMLRGVSARELRQEDAPGTRSPVYWRDLHPTLGHLLARAGYRAVTIPTSNMSDPRLGIQPGFETLWVANYDARDKLPSRSPMTQSFVPAVEVLPVALNVAKETPGRLFLWLHLMEPHYSYHWGNGQDGPPVVATYRRSVHDLAEQLANFVATFTRIRGKAPILAVFGDHGEEFFEHGGQYHASTVYAEQTRVGFVLSGPGIVPGRYDQPVSTTAVPATVLDLLGLATPKDMEPSLLGPMLGAASWPDIAVSELHAGFTRQTAYTGQRYRLIRDHVHSLCELFDTQTDPFDQHALQSDADGTQVTMRQLADAWDNNH